MPQHTVLEADVIRALRQIYDPEISVNIYDLGLVYEIKINEDNKVHIKMTMTAPNCPMAEDVLQQVKDAVADVPKVTGAEVELVWEPQWTTKMMSEEALLELGLL